MRDFALRLGGFGFEARGFHFLHAQFALQRERAGVAGTATADHAAVIAGAVDGEEMKFRIGAGERLCDARVFDDVGRLELGEKLIHGRAERLAEFHQAIETRENAGAVVHRVGSFAGCDVEAAERIDEESGAAAHFIAEKSYARAGGFEGFDHDVFEFVAEKLLDGVFELLFDFGVIGEKTDGAEIFGRRAVCGEEFLDGIGGIGAFFEDLREGSAARAGGGERLARGFRGLLQFLIRAAEIGEARLGFAGGLAEFLRASESGLRAFVGRVSALGVCYAIGFDCGERGGSLSLCAGKARHGFLALQGFGVAAYGFFAEAGGSEAELFDAGFERLLFGRVAGGGFHRFAERRFECGGVGAQLGDRFVVGGHAILQIGSFALGVLDFDKHLRGAHFELASLLLIEEDAIFGAIEIERRLAEEILRTAQLGFEFVIAGAEALLLGLEFAERARGIGFRGGHFVQRFLEALGFGIKMQRFAGKHSSQRAAHLLAQFGITACFRSLALQRGKLLFNFDEDVVDAREIHARGFEFGFGEAALRLVHSDAGSFFNNGAAIHGPRIQNLPDAALLDDGVGIWAKTHAHEEFLDVAEAGDAAIKNVFALARAVEAAADYDFAGLGRVHGFVLRALLAEFSGNA